MQLLIETRMKKNLLSFVVLYCLPGKTIDTKHRWLQITTALAAASICCSAAPWPEEIAIALVIFLFFGFARAYFWCGKYHNVE